MRCLLVVASLALAVVAQAQPASRGQSTVAPLPAIGLPLPVIGLPLPQIGLPLPSIGLPPVVEPGSGARDVTRDRDHEGPRPGNKRGGRSHASVVYFVPGYDWPYLPSEVAPPGIGLPAPASASSIQTSPTGWLRFEVEPAGATQVYADGYFVGTAADLGNQLELEPGTHRIDFRARGFETLALDVKIAASRVITYRGALEPAGVEAAPAPKAIGPEPAAAAPGSNAAPAPRSTIYFIPGCYLGNVPPTDIVLPQGCDLGRLITRTP